MSTLQGEFIASVLTLASFVYTFWPHYAIPNERETSRLDFLLERMEQLFENLRNLNFEYRAGKFADEDFLMQQAELEIEVSTLMTEIIDLQTT
jgi:hypothetical protein